MTTRGKKVDRARNDPRCSFLVEAGGRSADRALCLECLVAVIEPDPDLAARIAEATAAEYAAYRTRPAAMPSATRERYAELPGAVLELIPQGKMLTWDNRHLGLG